MTASTGDGRIGVHAVWHEHVGPALSLGMLTAAARHWAGGALNEHYEIHRPDTPDQVLSRVARGRGPALLLCSNYVWSLDDNLALARQAKAIHPELIVVHGGPSTPKYPGDAERFLAAHGDVADVLVRGEGEMTLCRLLEALAVTGSVLDSAVLGRIGGLTFRDTHTGETIRTADAERIVDLDSLPSPYLTGEFDHIEASAWVYAAGMETNRGCPYGCTYCDWGSATLSRLRKFDIDRVLAEFEWAADRGHHGVQICDANFGIMARDVDIAAGLAAIRRRTGRPAGLGFTPPKNTTKHVSQIFDEVIGAGIMISTAISLQTIDDDTLEAVERSNISIDHYLELAADLRRRGQPLTGDLLIGMPAQTYATYKADLQFFIDHQLMARTWLVKVLPNAPMNDAAYRARYAIETDERGLVVSTSRLAPQDIDRMHRLRKLEIIGQRHGVLRHVGHFLQWDCGIAMTDLLDHLIDVTAATPGRFPLITWALEYFDLQPTVPVGWHAFYAEVRRLLAEDYGLDPDRTDLDTVLRVQEALMPAPERQFPTTIPLAHDYVAYYRGASASLYVTGHASLPAQPLADLPPSTLTVVGDPLLLCTDGMRFPGDSRDPVVEGDFQVGMQAANELESPLLALLPIFTGEESAIDGAAFVADILAGAPVEPATNGAATGSPSGRRRPIPVMADDRASSS